MHIYIYIHISTGSMLNSFLLQWKHEKQTRGRVHHGVQPGSAATAAAAQAPDEGQHKKGEQAHKEHLNNDVLCSVFVLT